MEVSNIWGILAVPVGVVICFGPAVLVWLITEKRRERHEEPAEHRQLEG